MSTATLLYSFYYSARQPQTPPLFPYTTLFRSEHARRWAKRSDPRRRRRQSACRENRHLAAVRFKLAQNPGRARPHRRKSHRDRKSTRLNSSHPSISYAVFCLKKKKTQKTTTTI